MTVEFIVLAVLTCKDRLDKKENLVDNAYINFLIIKMSNYEY